MKTALIIFGTCFGGGVIGLLAAIVVLSGWRGERA